MTILCKFGQTDKYNIMVDMKNELFQKQYTLFEQELDTIGTAHAAQYTNAVPAFRFKGKVYNTGALSFAGQQQAKQLHVSLQDRMQDLYLRMEEFQREDVAPLEHYLRQAMNISKTPGDLMALVPTELHKHIACNVQGELSQHEPNRTLSDPAVALFRDKFRHRMDEVLERLTLNLIIS